MQSFGLSHYHYPHGTKNQEGLGQLLQVNSISGRDDECGKQHTASPHHVPIDENSSRGYGQGTSQVIGPKGHRLRSH